MNLLFIVLLSWAFAAPSWATNVTLEWDTVPELNIIGYRLSIRQPATGYAATYEVTPPPPEQSVVQLTIALPAEGYYFATVTAFNAYLESPPSDELRLATFNEAVFSAPSQPLRLSKDLPSVLTLQSSVDLVTWSDVMVLALPPAARQFVRLKLTNR